MEHEFIVLLNIGKEEEWLRSLTYEISLRSNNISYISILYDSVSTFYKKYNQVYNIKSR